MIKTPIIVHTPTKEEFVQVQEFVIGLGGSWNVTNRTTNLGMKFSRYGNQTCLYINNYLKITFASLIHYEKHPRFHRIKIITFSEFKKMTESRDKKHVQGRRKLYYFLETPTKV